MEVSNRSYKCNVFVIIGINNINRSHITGQDRTRLYSLLVRSEVQVPNLGGFSTWSKLNTSWCKLFSRLKPLSWEGLGIGLATSQSQC